MSTTTSYSVPSTIRAHTPSFLKVVQLVRAMDNDPAAPACLCVVNSGSHPKAHLRKTYTTYGEPQAKSIMTMFSPIVIPDLPPSDYVTILPVLARAQWAAFKSEHPLVSRRMSEELIWGLSCVVSASRAGIYAFLNAVPSEHDEIWAFLLSVIDYDNVKTIALNVQNNILSPIADLYCVHRAVAPLVTKKLHSFLEHVATKGAMFFRLALVAYSGKGISSSVDIGLHSLISDTRRQASEKTIKLLNLGGAEVWEGCLASCTGGYPLEYLREIAYDPMFSTSVDYQWAADYHDRLGQLRASLQDYEDMAAKEVPFDDAKSQQSGSAQSMSSAVTFRTLAVPPSGNAVDSATTITAETLAELKEAASKVVPPPDMSNYAQPEFEEKFAGF